MSEELQLPRRPSSGPLIRTLIRFGTKGPCTEPQRGQWIRKHGCRPNQVRLGGFQRIIGQGDMSSPTDVRLMLGPFRSGLQTRQDVLQMAFETLRTFQV